MLATVIRRPFAALEGVPDALPVGPFDARRVWATALAVTFLRQRASEREVEWRLLVEKAERWLRFVVTDTRSEEAVWALAAEALAG